MSQSRSVRYAIGDSPLGALVAAATPQGLCAVALGDSAAALEAALLAEIPAAVRAGPAEEPLAGYLAALLAYLAGRAEALDLPLDLDGTPFQQAVWAELRRIPYGQTRTYTQLAQALGQPEALRAVAAACGQNPAALVVPCHRVLRRGGALGGFRWGLERKAALLKLESSALI